jgi:hypothetical protein
MKEKIVNLFLYIRGEIIEEVGAAWHEADGTDAEKLAFLTRNVAHDYKRAKRYPLTDTHILVPLGGKPIKRRLSYPTFVRLGSLGKQMDFWEQCVFERCQDVPREPLMVVTPIVDGKVKIEAVVDMAGNPL